MAFYNIASGLSILQFIDLVKRSETIYPPCKSGAESIYFPVDENTDPKLIAAILKPPTFSKFPQLTAKPNPSDPADNEGISPLMSPLSDMDHLASYARHQAVFPISAPDLPHDLFSNFISDMDIPKTSPSHQRGLPLHEVAFNRRNPTILAHSQVSSTDFLDDIFSDMLSPEKNFSSPALYNNTQYPDDPMFDFLNMPTNKDSRDSSVFHSMNNHDVDFFAMYPLESTQDAFDAAFANPDGMDVNSTSRSTPPLILGGQITDSFVVQKKRKSSSTKEKNHGGEEGGAAASKKRKRTNEVLAKAMAELKTHRRGGVAAISTEKGRGKGKGKGKGSGKGASVGRGKGKGGAKISKEAKLAAGELILPAHKKKQPPKKWPGQIKVITSDFISGPAYSPDGKRLKATTTGMPIKATVKSSTSRNTLNRVAVRTEMLANVSALSSVPLVSHASGLPLVHENQSTTRSNDVSHLLLNTHHHHHHHTRQASHAAETESMDWLDDLLAPTTTLYSRTTPQKTRSRGFKNSEDDPFSGLFDTPENLTTTAIAQAIGNSSANKNLFGREKRKRHSLEASDKKLRDVFDDLFGGVSADLTTTTKDKDKDRDSPSKNLRRSHSSSSNFDRAPSTTPMNSKVPLQIHGSGHSSTLDLDDWLV